jgi:hypothetical protein
VANNTKTDVKGKGSRKCFGRTPKREIRNSSLTRVTKAR